LGEIYISKLSPVLTGEGLIPQQIEKGVMTSVEHAGKRRGRAQKTKLVPHVMAAPLFYGKVRKKHIPKVQDYSHFWDSKILLGKSINEEKPPGKEGRFLNRRLRKRTWWAPGGFWQERGVRGTLGLTSSREEGENRADK